LDSQMQELTALKATVESLQSTVASDSVTRALNTVRQLANRPAPLADPLALIASLEYLTDAGRDGNHPDRTKFEAIYRQCRPLANNPRLPAVAVRLLGDEEQKVVANQIQKILRSAPLPFPGDQALFGTEYGSWEPKFPQPNSTLAKFFVRSRDMRTRVAP
jgi:hypothetical protein